jgi:hypothetical protein
LGIVRSELGRQFVGHVMPGGIVSSPPTKQTIPVSRSRSRTPSRSHDAGRSTATRTAWYRRGIPWGGIAVSLLVFVSAMFAVDPIRDAGSLAGVGEARLDVSPAYMSIAPISSILDTLTLLTVGQHIALLLWVIGVFVVWRVARARRRRTSLGERRLCCHRPAARDFSDRMPPAPWPSRPMAQLAVSDESVIAIDFHAHTKYSHDGRAGWTDDDVRRWQRGAGFNAAYITDHRTFEGAERGIASNPGVAGEGTILLQGVEAGYNGEHVNVLSAGRRYKGVLTADLRDIDEQSLMLAAMFPATTPLLIETIPGNLSKVLVPNPRGVPPVQAIEIVDGSPRGLSQGRRDRARIVHLADSLNLALVSGSDNHGWGRVAPAWTLMRIPGWRGMPTDSLSRRIEDVLRVTRREATRVIERRVADGQNPVALALTAPVVAWRMLTTLSGTSASCG